MTSNERLLGLPLPTPLHRQVRWGKLHGASVALAIAESIVDLERPCCIVAATAAEADRLDHEIRFFAPEAPVRRFPDYETLPYESISPPQDLLSERLAILDALANDRPAAVIVTSDTLLGRLPPKSFVLSRSLRLAVGQALDRDATVRQLIDHGYLRVERVAGPGELAVRGEVIDIYAAGSETPVRIDLFDEEIEKLRTFDAMTQLSTGETQSIQILPAREFPFDADAIRGFRLRFRDAFPVEPGRAPIYRDISEAVLPAGIEYYLPLFFDETSSLLDYLSPESLIIEIGEALAAFAEDWALIVHRYEQLHGDAERPLLPPEQAFHAPAAIAPRIAQHPSVTTTTHRIEPAADGAGANAAVAGALTPQSVPDRDAIAQALAATEHEQVLIVASSPGRREMIAGQLADRQIQAATADRWPAWLASPARLTLIVGEIEQGFELPEHRRRVVTAESLGLEKPRQRVVRRRRTVRDADAIVRELTDLQIGAPVVHEDYGIGRYRGLVTLSVDDQPMEFLALEYADQDKLYVPVHSLHLVSRYTGAAPENAPLHKLGSDQWATAKRKAAQKARDVAAELLHIYAKRAARPGTAMDADQSGYQRFALEFPYEETDDQLDAIRDVLADLAEKKSMDRIVCGDVGFGKTEVALRSAFVVTDAGFQVAVLVPTTLLAQQHFRTFSDRFASWPVTVAQLSRFNSSAETRATLEGLEQGTVDIVIGTHRLLQRDVKFKKLGLVIVDEEHRFGVKHKEQLKRLRADVDILTMTATPIPRTLNMSLGGLRDLSIIATPPTDRLAVKTFVGEWNDVQIRDALLREIRRGGQVYVVHNRVEDIERIAHRIRALVPEATVNVAHGQMPESALGAVMIDFYHRRFNVLVCTTIIESGIDIPTANTMIVDRADRFGLAQLHQLRGRVGRSHHQAYAYMIAPPLRALSDEARKRLEAIEALEALGSGFTLATHDLEIRGAGELLGEEQSGQISAVGFTLYNELLARAVSELRAGREPDLDDPFAHGPEIDTGLVALIPEDYMPDVHMRLVHYKRIAGAQTRDELDELQVEMIDRFGPIPPPTKTLFAIVYLKLLAATLGIVRVRAGRSGGSIEFGRSGTKVDAEAIVGLIQAEPATYRLDGPYKLRFHWDTEAGDRRIEAVETILRRLGAREPLVAAA